MEQALEYGISPKMNYDFFNPFGRVCYAGCPYHFTLGSDGKLRKCVFLPICYAQMCPRNCVTDKEPACGEDFPLMTELILNKYKRKKKLEQSEVR